MSDYKIAGKAEACVVCGEAFAPGVTFISSIFERADDSFERQDACMACEEGVEGVPYSRWVTRLPEEASRAPKLDLGLAREFLVRLARENDPSRHGLMYILALLLMRKRKVKLREQGHDGETALLSITVASEHGDVDLEVRAPELTEGETNEIEEQLGRLFGSSAG